MNVNDDLSVHTDIRSFVSMKDTHIKEPTDTERNSNDFGESACGEPLTPQHLVVDFTPNDEDTEFIQKKCCAFWDFITSCPELENFIIRPNTNTLEKKSRSSDIELAPIKICKEKQEQMKSAVSMIEFIEEKGLITRAFESKLPQSGCSVGSLDYFDEKPKISRVPDKEEVCKCSRVCKTCTAKLFPEQQPRRSRERIQEMCKELKDWDVEHPKSMEPPGHPPSLDEP